MEEGCVRDLIARGGGMLDAEEVLVEGGLGDLRLRMHATAL
jgi:hypothetical protein